MTPAIPAAPDLEAAWLSASGDGLPALLTRDGGPWDVIQAYMPRTPHQRQTQIYVLRRKVVTRRLSQQRRITTHHIVLALVWPIGQGTTAEYIAEDEQRAFDAAIDLLVTRIEAYVGDKSHGGRFLSVGEADGNEGTERAHIEVDISDPAETVPGGYLIANVSYLADSPDRTV